MGINFNPSADDTVGRIKSMAAQMIDFIDGIPTRVSDQHGGETDDARAAERARLKALAQTAIEEAAMWAVKAATKPGMDK